jgi:hypothetical protein
MSLCPPSHTFDVEIVIQVHVIGGAVAAGGSAAEGEGGHHVVVNTAQRSNGSRRIHNDPAGIDHLTEPCDDLIVARENDRRMSKPPGMIHLDTDVERLLHRLRAIDREYGEQLLGR